MSEPFVSVLILNRNGRAGLETCLPSLQKQDYARDRFEILLVDNGSTDDSIPFIHERFPSVRVVQHDRNRGVGAAFHAAIPQTRGDYLAFLDNHTRVEPTWMRELVGATARDETALAASKILNRDGTQTEFAGGILSLVGHTWPLARGAAPASRGTKSAPLLFGCTAAMLVERSAYDAAGGFDPDYFAYGEDVDLGWRMSLLGYKAILAPEAVAYRQRPAHRFAIAPRIRLEERNALYTIYKCYGEDLLYRVLPVAIGLTLGRASHHSVLNPADFAPGASPPGTTPVSRRTIATLMALADFAQHLGHLRKKREAIQSRRRVTDESLLPLFVEPLKTHDLGPTYEKLASELYDEFGLSQLRSGASPEHLERLTTFPTRPEKATASSPEQGVDSYPTVSIVIPTALGPTHLPECLSSLRDLNYPKEKLEVIVVDNGSREDPTPDALQHYPEVKVIRLSENRGFCGGIAAGAHQAQAEWLAFLNDDTRVDPGWIREMLATAERRQTPCVAARILNWTGERIDFAGGAINFEAKGFQLGHGSTKIDSWNEERPVLFACGAAMLVRRDLFLETGGFDETMFAYYEDVAFGWQLSILGHDVWLSPTALVYHKHQGTARHWASPLRTRLYERNALRTVFTHFEPQTLHRVLPAALLLLNQRILLTAGLAYPEPGETISLASARRFYRRARHQDGVLENLKQLGVKNVVGAVWSAATSSIPGGSRAVSAYRMEDGLQDPSFDEQPETMPAGGAAGLVALREWLESLPEQRRRRQELQRQRRRSDAEILSAFPSHWTNPAGPAGAEPLTLYNRVHEAVVQAFSLEEIAKNDGAA